jgi:hypothetical protein
MLNCTDIKEQKFPVCVVVRSMFIDISGLVINQPTLRRRYYMGRQGRAVIALASVLLRERPRLYQFDTV